MNNNYSELAKYIYGAMKYKDLPVSNEDVAVLEDVANDYCVKKIYITNLINTASYKHKKNPNFDYIAFIYYGLIIKGKDSSAKRVRTKHTYRY